MVTAIPPLSDSEKLEVGASSPKENRDNQSSKLVVASYNIRYAAGPFLISGGLLRKAGLRSSRGRSEAVAKRIHVAAEAFSSGALLPRVDVLALQEADKKTTRAGGHHIARALATELSMNWAQAPAGIPRGIKPQPRQWWLDFEEPIELHDSGDTGIALLSHLPLAQVTRIDLPWHKCPWRPRLAMARFDPGEPSRKNGWLPPIRRRWPGGNRRWSGWSLEGR